MLSGRTAVVTSTARGIGQGIDRTFTAHGAQVVIVDLDSEGAADATKALDTHAIGLRCASPPPRTSHGR